MAVAPPPRPLGPPEVQVLIDQLADRDYRVRESAEGKLRAHGFVALPLLRKALGHHDPEIRRRALRLVPGLEHAALVEPKRITMNVKDQPLNTILNEITNQTGYKMQAMGGFARVVRAGPLVGPPAAGRGPQEPTYSYNFHNEPFWNVIERICRDANLSVQQGYGDEMIRFYQGSGYTPYAGRDGAFRYVASNFQLYRNVDLTFANPAAGASPSARNESLTLNVNLFAEPRLPFLGMGDVRLEVAYDNERNSMIPPSQIDPSNEFGGRVIRRSYYNGGYKQVSMQGSISLTRLSEKATVLKHVKGVIPVTLLVEQKPVTLADNILKVKNKKTQVGDIEFTIESVLSKGNSQYEIKFTATNKGANVNDYSWQNGFYQRLELLDDKGVKYQNWGSSYTSSGGGNVSMTMTYNGALGAAKPGPPARVVYQHWVTKQHDIAFEFRDVPLP